MPQYQIDRGRRASRSPRVRITLVVLIIALLFAARTIASYVIDVEWWKELGQLDTWLSMLTYSFAPLAAATLIAFGVLWITHARALKFAGTSLARARPVRAPVGVRIINPGLYHRRCIHR